MSAAEIAKALGGRRQGWQWIARCPAHDDHSPSLTISGSPDSERLLLHCFAGCEFIAILAALRERGLVDVDAQARFQPNAQLERAAREGAAAERRGRTERARELWHLSLPAHGTPVETYLQHRGCTGTIPATLRFHPGIKHAGTGLLLPAMVAAVTHWPTRDVVAVHRTYLTADGCCKAPVPSPKMMLGPVRGGALRLAAAAKEMAVCEGIETGLSVQLGTGVATWAALSARGIETLVLPNPPLAELVYIAADNDPPGLAAANRAAARFLAEGRRVKIVVPPTPGADWNDEAQHAA